MKFFFFLALAFIGLTCCKDRDQDQTTLPPATQSGTNTAGARVDGKIWVATTDRLNTANGSGTYCEKTNNNYTILLDLRQSKESYNNSIFIKVLILDLEINKNYNIITQTPNSDYNFATYTDGTARNFSSNSNYSGSIKITKIDIENQIVSGTFEFKGIDNNGSTVNVTDGRFDKKFD